MPALRLVSKGDKLRLCFVLVGAALTACARADAADSEVVKNTGELRAAVRSATPGSTILVAPGDYGEVVLRKVDRGGNLVIAASDRHDRPRFTGLKIDASSNLTIRGIEVALGDRAAVEVGSSRGIRFEDLVVHGEPSEKSIGGGNGIAVRRSRDVAVVRSEFRNLGNAISHRDTNGVLIEGNRIHDIRVDGIHGGGSSNMTIRGNAFWNFSRLPEEHPDAIQFWTTNAKESASNIQILNNLIIRGEGGRMQGMFITDQSKGRLPYLGLVVTGNVVVGSMYHGITVSSAVSPIVENNVVMGYSDMKAWINVDRSTDATVRGNQATAFRLSKENAGIKATGNKTIKAPKVGDARFLGRWYATSRAGLPALPEVVAGSFQGR